MTTTDGRERHTEIDDDHPVVRVEEEHHTLREQLDTIQSATTRTGLLEDMLALPKMLVEHFTIEEQAGGLYDDLRKRRPDLATGLDALKEEHQVILDELDEIHLRLKAQIETERAVDDIPESMTRDVQRWIERLRGHEREESSMIGDVYYTDEGGFG
jgi:hypothetical protein